MTRRVDLRATNRIFANAILINDRASTLYFFLFLPLDKPNGLSLVGVLDELYVVFLSVDIHTL